MIELNNHSLGMVRQWQRMFSKARYSETDTFDDVDGKMFLESYGIKYFRAETMEELDFALKESAHLRTTVFIECLIDHDESVFPIVPPGRPINELLLNG